MDLSALEIFRAVATEGSVTRAAERLGRVQSNVTTRVQQLEEQLGSALFRREGKRMLLTPAGESLRSYADRLLALAEEARQAVRGDTPSGRLRLGAMESTAAARLPQPLARLHAQWPELLLDVSTAASCQLVEQVLAHTLDAALVAWPPPGVDPEAAVDRTTVFTEELLLALPASHAALQNKGALELDTLAAFAPGCTYRSIGEAWVRQRNGRAPRVLELASTHRPCNWCPCSAATRCWCAAPATAPPRCRRCRTHCSRADRPCVPSLPPSILSARKKGRPCPHHPPSPRSSTGSASPCPSFKAP